MKLKNIKLLIIAAVVLLAASCTDLNVDIKSQYTSFPNSQEAAEAISASVYNAYRGALGRQHWLVETLSSDEAVSVAMGSDYYDGGVYYQMDVHSWNADNNMLETMWNSAMNGVTAANQVLNLLGDTTIDNAAPIRAMRAFYYFILADNFGAAPLVYTTTENQPDRSSRADVCKFIESELLAVRNQLPTEVSSATYGTATRWMADALLAKLYLNWAVYTASDVADYSPSNANSKLNDCVAVCDDIIASGNFDLTDDYMVKFRPTNGFQIKDFIFAMPYDRQTQRGMYYARFWICRSAQKQFGDIPQSVAGTLRCLPDFYDKFHLAGDRRNDSYLIGPQYYWENYEQTTKPFMIETTNVGYNQDYAGTNPDSTISVQLTFTKNITLRPGGESTMDVGNDVKGRSEGYRSVKFIMDPDVTTADGRSQSNDVPIFRYADVLLMKAEAELRGAKITNNETPTSLVDQIRAYNNAPNVEGTATLDTLLDERAREFHDESWRRNDLIRFGKFEDNWGFKYLYPEGYTEKFRRIFPVPTNVLNANTNWTQNTGY